MTLKVEVSGQGAPLVLLHGWGMHGGIWGGMAERLAHDFEVHRVDLPGHGKSDPSVAFTLDLVVDELADGFGQPVDVLGWSLGGIVAQNWALLEPGKIRRLVLVASTPCFASRPDWEHGMAQETLAQFASELENNFAATLRRFLALQVRGSENERELLTRLRNELFSRGEPDIGALRGGLDILRNADLRGGLPQIAQPVLVIAGEKDRLTPPEASQYMAQMLPDARLVEITGAAHAPFLSHPEEFVNSLKRFMKDKNY